MYVYNLNVDYDLNVSFKLPHVLNNATNVTDHRRNLAVLFKNSNTSKVIRFLFFLNYDYSRSINHSCSLRAQQP